MKTFLQGLLCLFLISALNQPCQAKLSAKRKKTLVYYIVSASVITVAVLAGGGVLYYQRSRRLKQNALPYTPLGRPPLHPRTPRKNKQTLLRPHPKTPNKHQFARTILADSALIHLSPEKLKALAPQLTFGVPYPIQVTPPHDQHKRSRRISMELAQRAPNSSYIDGGVLIPGMKRFRGPGMRSPKIGTQPSRNGFPRTRLSREEKEALAAKDDTSDSD